MNGGKVFKNMYATNPSLENEIYLYIIKVCIIFEETKINISPVLRIVNENIVI